MTSYILPRYIYGTLEKQFFIDDKTTLLRRILYEKRTKKYKKYKKYNIQEQLRVAADRLVRLRSSDVRT